ncbi:MAG: YraN family protein [Elusimicrobiaceae bacterium]|nr:YraN family protein [Elusimicrobiaceae bacterium]
MNSSQSGAQGEEAAAHYLTQKGYHLLARNYRQPCGEIDLICSDGKTLVFVEVKKRASQAFGGPLAAVTLSKQRKIALTAQYFIKEIHPKFDSIRFDVVCLLGGQITHIENAFFPPRGTF